MNEITELLLSPESILRRKDELGFGEDWRIY